MSEAKGPYRFEYDNPPGSTKLGAIVDARGAFVMTGTRQMLYALNAAHAAGVAQGRREILNAVHKVACNKCVDSISIECVAVSGNAS